MTEIISIVDTAQEPPKDYFMPVIRERTMAFMNSQTKLDEDGKLTIIEEAQDILSHCILPGNQENITNIAVGYVQSGKTLSFTTLTALAADNGWRIIIYLTGTKTNLKEQTSARLRSDLIIDDNDDYKIFADANISDRNRVKNFMEMGEETLLFPILKHYKHINSLAQIFEDPEIQNLLSNYGVIIIDDEADQASFNTFAKKNSGKEDWEDDDFSQTYSAILRLKKALPNHSYIQYTATPQAAFLIDNNDILSPKYHTVLTPGKGYTGGKFFFKNQELNLISIIPDEEIYHFSRNPLTEIPTSLLEALRQFIISVTIVVLKQKRQPFLSMMVHIDGRRDTNETFEFWISNNLQNYLEILNAPDGDPGKIPFINSLKSSFDSITQYMSDRPDFEEILPLIPRAILRTQCHLVQGDSESLIDWNSEKGHILIGADMLNRGFTIERLSMSYMPRTSAGRSTADAIEQRCRFFGYKMPYIDVCRVFLSSKSRDEYTAYVEHEEVLRASLKQCQTIKEFSKNSTTMLLSDLLNPTRTNILSDKLVRDKLIGWRQMLSLDCMHENKRLCLDFIDKISSFITCDEYDNEIRNHRHALVPIDDFIQFFREFKYLDVPNITRKIVTIQYLQYIKEFEGIEFVDVYQMAYQTETSLNYRRRSIKNDKPNNLQAGRAANGSYPGDKHFHSESVVSVQLHHIVLDDPGVIYGKKDLFNLAVYYPASIGEDFIRLDKPIEDEDIE